MRLKNFILKKFKHNQKMKPKLITTLYFFNSSKGYSACLPSSVDSLIT